MAWNTHNIKQFTTQRYQLQMGQHQSNPLQNSVWKSRHANLSRKVVCLFISFNIFYAVMKTSFRVAEVNNLTWAWHKKPHQMSAKKKCQFNRPICWARVNEFYFYSFRGKISIYRQKSMKNISWKYHRRRRIFLRILAPSNYCCLLTKYSGAFLNPKWRSLFVFHNIDTTQLVE